MNELRPKQLLKDISRKWPNVWEQFKIFRKDKGKSLPDWPDWCYVPIAAGYAIYTQGVDTSAPILDFKHGPAVITAAAAWRVTQGVYRFDEDLYNALISQPMIDNLPCEALKRLPEWCVYIETYNSTFDGKPFSGFMAHLEKDANDGTEELRLVLMMDDGDNFPMPLHIGDWTLDEGLRRMQAVSDKNAKQHYPGFKFQTIDYQEDVEPLLQLVLYLCAENIDIPMLPAHPRTRVRMSGQVDIAREPHTWTVGMRIGTSIRKYRKEVEMNTHDDSLQGNHASPRPHVRRAHWHHFWKGPRDGNRTLILRWLPPIPVGVDDESQLPAVIHKVERE